MTISFFSSPIAQTPSVPQFFLPLEEEQEARIKDMPTKRRAFLNLFIIDYKTMCSTMAQAIKPMTISKRASEKKKVRFAAVDFLFSSSAEAMGVSFISFLSSSKSIFPLS